VAQSVGPEFKPQYQKAEEEKREKKGRKEGRNHLRVSIQSLKNVDISCIQSS
jgi:hypothetical protein